MKFTKRLLALALALCMALPLCACGETETEQLTVRAAFAGTPTTLDPAHAVTETEKTVTAHLFENLMKQSLNGVTAAQAASYTYTDNMDGTETYTFTLRSDIYWSDGQAVTAGDFVYAWQRLVDPETHSPHASILNMVAGYSEAAAGDPSALQVSAPDDHTFVVVIEGHCSYFLSVVCTAVSTMPVRADAVAPEVDEDAVDADDAADADGEDAAGEIDWSLSADTLLTNGAYTVDTLTADSLTASVAAQYYDARRLSPDRLAFFFTATSADAMALYDSEEVDFVLDAGDVEGAVEASAASVRTVLVNQMATSLAEELRQAMSLVIDRNTLAEIAGDSYRAADGLIPEGIVTSTGISFRQANGAAIDNDPESYDERCQLAVELLRNAGYTTTRLESMTPVSLLYESGSVNANVAQQLQLVWREKLGLRVNSRSVSAEELAEELESGEFSLALVNISGDRNTALGYLNRFSSGQQGNYGQYYSNAYDMLIRTAANASSDEARDAYLADAETMLLESGYVMPLYLDTYTWVLRDTLTGLQSDGMGVFSFQNVAKATS